MESEGPTSSNRTRVLQIGQLGTFVNHLSTHLAWKTWSHTGSTRQISPSLKYSKQIEQSSEAAAVDLSAAGYWKGGMWFCMSWREKEEEVRGGGERRRRR